MCSIWSSGCRKKSSKAKFSGRACGALLELERDFLDELSAEWSCDGKSYARYVHWGKRKRAVVYESGAYNICPRKLLNWEKVGNQQRLLRSIQTCYHRHWRRRSTCGSSRQLLFCLLHADVGHSLFVNWAIGPVRWRYLTS